MAETKKTEYPNLASALVAFQADLPKIERDSQANIPSKTGQGYKYDYASLDVMTPIIFKKLSEVGLAYTAAPSFIDGTFGLYAQLIHTSGESIGGLYPLGNPNAPAQAIGSAITYARRYALLALTGVQPADQDDDGAAASQAAASAAAPKVPAKETAETVREDMGSLVNNPTKFKVSGEDANTIMEEVAPGKTPNQWTLTELKKGRDKLLALSNERIAESK